MGQRSFAGARVGAPADESGVGDGVVGRSKRSFVDEGLVWGQAASDGVYLGGGQSFFESEVGEDGGDAACEHGFTRTRRTDHQDDVV